MADSSESPKAPVVGRGPFRLLVVGLPVVALLGAGGFYIGYSMSGLPWQSAGTAAGTVLPEATFVPLAPVIINLGPSGSGRHLRLAAEIEVVPAARTAVARLEPRIRDVVNGYLRALDLEQIEAAGALVRIRQHLLRRIRMITDPEQVKDLLITEFVVN